MKKSLLSLLLVGTAVCVSACNVEDFLSVVFPSIESSSTSEYSSQAASSSSSSSTSSSSSKTSSSSTSSSTSTQTGDGYYYVDDLTTKTTYKDLNTNQGYDVLSATGTTKLLVFMIEFSDYPFGASVRTDLDHALNGNGATDTGYWESVSSYYNKSSYGKVNLQYDIAPVHTASVTAKDFVYNCYKNYSSAGFGDSGSYGSCVMCEEAVTAWKNNGGNAKNYDGDGDGLIDGIIMVYSCPNSYDTPISVKKGTKTYKDEGDLFWAFCYWDLYTEQYNPTNPNPFLFFWMSYDFLYEAVKSPKVDSHTLIHESGHMFGLDDYYGDDNTKVTGTMSMMDYNIMDLDAYSKVALGWAGAYVVEDSCTINLKPMTTDRQVIIVAPSNNGTTTFKDSAFEEYILIELYTPDELNYLDSHTQYSSRRKGFSTAGIRLWHVDARIVSQYYNSQGLSNTVTYVDSVNMNDNSHYYFVGASNTYKYDEVDSSFNLLTLIDKAGKVYTENDPYSTVNSLFQTGDSFTWNSYKKYFPKSTTLNNGKKFNFTINFDSVSASGATISFVRN